MGLYGGGGGGGADDQIRYQNEQAAKQYEYDKNVYDFQWEGNVDNPVGQQWKSFNHAVEGYKIRQANDKQARDYQNETAAKNWEYGLSINDYQQEQQTRAWKKSEDVFGKTVGANSVAFEQAIERENAVLEEQFIDMAFQNTDLIQDLYEATGTAGYNQVAVQLGLDDQKGQLDYENLKKLTDLKHRTGQAEFAEAGAQLQMVDQHGQIDYRKAGIQQDLFSKEALNRFQEVGIDLNVREAKSREDYENDVLMRQFENSQAQAAFGIQQQYVEALQKEGAATLTQAGRSQGKAVQVVLAEVARQQNYLIDTLIRGKEAADAQIKNNKINTLNVEARAVLEKSKLDFNTLDNITRATMDLEEADRALKIGSTKSNLDIEEIRQGVEDITEATDIDVNEIARNLRKAEEKAGFDSRKIDWDIENFGSRFKHNQHILKASLDSAVQSSLLNRKDLVTAKYGADLEAEARRMLRPERTPDPEKPLDLPIPVYQDPLAPEKPPEPIQGALMQQSSGSSFGSVGGAAVGGALAGLGAYGAAAGIGSGAAAGSFAAGIGAAAPYIGIAVGLGTLLFG